MQAIRVLGSMPQTNANIFAAGTALIIGVGANALPHDLIMRLTALLRPFIAAGIIMSFLVAAFMHIVFNLMLRTGDREAKRIENTPENE
jgi:xanthine/uracil permease